MRKLVFAALAGVFMLSSGFVKKELTSPQGDCTVVIQRTSIDEEGNEVTQTRIHYTTAADRAACNSIASFIGRAYELGVLKF
ncbi:MAG: hypothetical protein ABF247_08825 [Nonlabens sp.]